MRRILAVSFLLLASVGVMFDCGEKIPLPTETPFEGNLGDTLYLQINPPWDVDNGYDFNNPQAIFFGKDTST